MENNGNAKGNRYAGLAFFAVGVGCFVLAGFLVYLFSGKFVNTPSGMRAGPALSLATQPPSPAPEPASAPSPERRAPVEPKEWVLYITGEVTSPGVYRLPPESRVYQLVEAAGGLTPKADPVQINMASPLGDGMHVHVPALRPVAPVMEVAPGGGVPSPVQPSSLVAFPASSPSAVLRSAPAFSSGGRVNVNTASAAELEMLPGVGPAIASAIIEYRAARGRFASVEDLLRVKGIGAKKLEAMRNFVAVQ